MVGDRSQQDHLPDVLALMIDKEIASARSRGEIALVTSVDAHRLIWLSAVAAQDLGLPAGPRLADKAPSNDEDLLLETLATALAHSSDGSAASATVQTSPGGANTTLKAETRQLGEDGPVYLLWSGPASLTLDPQREGLSILSEIGAQPIAVWHSEGSWFDAGFNDIWQVYSEDLHEALLARGGIETAFLPDGRSIGLLRLSPQTVAVWHLRDESIQNLDFSTLTQAPEEEAPSDVLGEPSVGEDTTEAVIEQPAEAEEASPIGADTAYTETLPPNPPAPTEAEAPQGEKTRNPPFWDVQEGFQGFWPIASALRSFWGPSEPAGQSRNDDAARAKSDDDRQQEPPAETSASIAKARLQSAWWREGAPSQQAVRNEVPDKASDRDAGDQEAAEESKAAESETTFDTAQAASHPSDFAPKEPAFSEPQPDNEEADPVVSPASQDEASEGLEPDVTETSETDQDAMRAARRDDFGRLDEQGPSAEDARAGDEEKAAPVSEERLDTAAEPSTFKAPFDRGPVRFIWRIDHDGRFHSISSELAEAVGPRAADVVGLDFADFLEALDLDPDGALPDLVERRETWSGRTVYWPVEASDRRIPVDLAALPIYARDRSFDGFRGFGIARPGESEPDPEAIGERLAAGVTLADLVDAYSEARSEAETDFEDELAPVFGRRPAEERPEATHPSSDETQGVIQLDERRRQREAPLSQEEADAFRAIGAALSRSEDNESLEEAIRVAKDRIALFDRRASEAGNAAAETGLDEGSDELDIATARPSLPLAEALAALYAHLPIPILVQAGETLVFVNDEFADFTGYRSVESLETAGGLDQLIMDGAPGEALSIRRANGDQVKARAHMHRVTVASRSVLVFSFFATPRMTLALIEDFRKDGAAPMPPPAPEPASLDGRIEDLAAALQAAGEAVILIDADRHIEAMNARGAQIFGLGEVDRNGRNDAVGRPFVSLFAHESQRPLLDLLKGEDTLSLDEGRELVGRRADGLFVPVTVLVDRMDGGGWCAVIGSDSKADRAASEEARLKAEAASLQKTQFLANISHEIRTPMNAILGFADAIASEAFGPIGNPRYLDYVGDIKRSGRHVLELVNDLLDLSKAEAGKLQLDYAAVALNEVAGEVVAMMQPVAGSARVILRSNLPASVPPVVADERSARQIILNLVQNAVNFTPAGGQVIVSSQYRPDGSVVLRCRDSGVGMSEEEIATAMTPFQRLRPKSGISQSTGTGLGLPLARTMAEANRAEFRIESSPQGGTLVELRFPPERVLAD
ncbi:MAG: ATP-binding protein [Pseudomonadota bacterium]|nr:ATP-binding protein [Pseudomonadota bacterium]